MSQPERPHTTTPTFASLVEARYSRRQFLKRTALAGLAVAASSATPSFAKAATSSTAHSLNFYEIPKNNLITHMIAPGYHTRFVLRWGDPLTENAPEFDPLRQSAAHQKEQFGYNNDYLAYLPFPQGSGNSSHGLLCANHEYSTTYLMFPGMTRDTAKDMITKDQVDVELASVGHSIVEMQRKGNNWAPVLGSNLNRRITLLDTEMDVSGPAAGHARMKTSADPAGLNVIGTFGNCAGGVTPWDSVLVCEENFNFAFGGVLAAEREAKNHERYGVDGETWYAWSQHYDRFDLSKEPNEPNRFGWVVEYDPYDPTRKPVKHTMLGRVKHETATPALTADNRVAVYTGDDSEFEYLYRFVSSGKYNKEDRASNFGLLADGTLYVGKFEEDGTMEWLPLVYGKGPLTEENGFHDQGEVLIETRRAADLLGATPMDRPEGIAIHPTTGHVYVSLTNNKEREEDQVNPVNKRAHNKHGQILELMPPKGDHGKQKMEWKIFLQGGNPAEPGDGARYGGKVSEHGWLSCPDNLAMDPDGNLWIACDGQPKSIGKNDSLYATATVGEYAARPKHFFTGPVGSEITGPCFTTDGSTLFLSVQHPGEGSESSFNDPTTRWPDFNPNMPPRPAVMAIMKRKGGKVGS